MELRINRVRINRSRPVSYLLLLSNHMLRYEQVTQNKLAICLMVKPLCVANSVINNVVYEKIIRLLVMQNIRTSREILSLMLIS